MLCVLYVLKMNQEPFITSVFFKFTSSIVSGFSGLKVDLATVSNAYFVWIV